VLAAGGGVAGGAVGVGERQLGCQRAGQQVGGGEQAERLGAALGVVGGPLEAGHRLTDPAGGHVLASGLHQLVRSHHAPPLPATTESPVVAIVSELGGSGTVG
jgi:hypothetical protein